jgi:hypothetical protein
MSLNRVKSAAGEPLPADHRPAPPPPGDGDNTTAFVCRAATGLRRWSAHALGLAVDVNPFHNPYTRGDLVLPEPASSYVDRSWRRRGMIAPGDRLVLGRRLAGTR